jgi:autotransporter-associated beta strand protein
VFAPIGTSQNSDSTIEVAGGTLRAGNATALDNYASSLSSTTVDAGATLDFNNFAGFVENLQGAGTVTAGTATLTIDAGDFSGIIAGGGGLTKATSGTLVLSGTNTYTGGTTNSYGGGTTISAGVLNVSADNNLGAASGGLAFNGGTLQFGSAFNLANTRTITLNGGGGTLDTNGFNTIVSQGITGAGGLTKTGAGTLTLSGSDSYSGGTVLNAGILVVITLKRWDLGTSRSTRAFWKEIRNRSM